MRLLHLSDLHAGSVEETEVERGLAPLIERIDPQLVVATGDLAHRGRRGEHERAASFLRALGRPLLVIPGNHDIPYTFPARFTSPWTEFERQWQTVEPVHRSDGLVVIGLNSVRPWRHLPGGVRSLQAGPRSAAPAAPRRGARTARLRGPRCRAERRDLRLARGRLGTHGAADLPARSRAAQVGGPLAPGPQTGRCWTYRRYRIRSKTAP